MKSRLSQPRRSLGLAFLLLALLSSAASAQSADSVQLQATLIRASNDGNGTDRALLPFEPTLKRLFKYDSYELRNRSAAKVSLPGQARMNLGNGHHLEIGAQAAASDKVRFRIRWFQADDLLVNTTVVASRDRPTVLGGPSTEDVQGSLLLVVVPR